MQKTFGPAATETEGKPLQISCRTARTYCFLLYGSNNCHDVKPPRPVPDTNNTPDWCKYRAQTENDAAERNDYRRMGLDRMNRPQLSAFLKSLPQYARGIDPTSKKPWRLTEMNAEMMRHAIRLQRLRQEASNA